MSLVIVLQGCAATVSTIADNRSVTEPMAARAGSPAYAFAPLSGPPAAVADRLAISFASASQARGLPLASYGNRKSALVIKGFISVVPGADGTTAVYVWDVLDANLKRLHRISGQTTDPAKAADGWDALSEKTLDTIAETTLDQLALWQAGQ